jgi:hypothetical protein
VVPQTNRGMTAILNHILTGRTFRRDGAGADAKSELATTISHRFESGKPRVPLHKRLPQRDRYTFGINGQQEGIQFSSNAYILVSKLMNALPCGTPQVLSIALAAFVVGHLQTMAAQTHSVPPEERVKRTVQKEIESNSDDTKFMFRVRRETPRGSQTRLMVQTNEAIAAVTVAVNDRRLSSQQLHAEEARLQHLIQNPDELSKKRKQEKEDAERVTRIMKALPEAFLYEYAGIEQGRRGVGKEGDELVRLSFRPNPDYNPPSRVEQVLTGMEGTILIDEPKQRIARIDGRLVKQVGFGWGILGHLDRGGHFLVEQGDLANNHWEITRMDLSFTGRLLLFKGLNIKSNEVYDDFHLVPSDLTFAQGVDLLKKQEAVLAKKASDDESK